MTIPPKEPKISSNDHNTNKHEIHNPSPESSDILSEVYTKLKSGQPFIISHEGHHGEKFKSVRETNYKGHHIIIRTLYEIEVDGKPINDQIYVGNNGSVSTHVLPNYSFTSTVDLIESLIDKFPDSFQGNEHEHEHEHAHEHGGT